MGMTINMDDARLVTFSQLENFTKAAGGITFAGAKRKDKYAWVEKILRRFFYASERKKNKVTIRNYIMKVTGYAEAQVTRLVRKMKKTKCILPWSREKCASFKTRYTTDDVALLLFTDNAHGRLSGKATKELFRRASDVFGKTEYGRLKGISVSHLYNLRGKRQYVSQAATFRKTNPTAVPIGERRKPIPNGKPGYIRVDSVHQGDLDKQKGVYHVNLVDEVTQWELVGCVEGISEHFLEPLLKALLAQFPFRLIEFHSDNGSEYINYIVAKLLNKLSIEQTKSRPRKSNDNALVEGKNGSVIRKHMGYAHIPRCHAKAINAFYQAHFNTYLNFHRPSGYATTTIDRHGKERKTYDVYETPYERLKKIPDAQTYLRNGITFAEIDLIAYAKSDNECATLMQEAKTELLKTFRNLPV